MRVRVDQLNAEAAAEEPQQPQEPSSSESVVPHRERRAWLNGFDTAIYCVLRGGMPLDKASVEEEKAKRLEWWSKSTILKP